MLRTRAEAHPDRVAVVDHAGPGGARRAWTYAELDLRADRLAAGLAARGIGAGDKVVVQLPNVAEFLEVVFALFRVGALPVFALPAHRESEISYFCSFTGAAAYVIPDVHGGFDHRALATTVLARSPSCGTSSSSARTPDPSRRSPTSRPSPSTCPTATLGDGVPPALRRQHRRAQADPRTHDDYVYSLRGSAEICALDEDSVYLCVLPAAHNFPLSSPGSLGTLYAGGRVVMCPRPAPDVAFPLIQDEGVTITGLVPPLALVWIDAAPGSAYDLSTLDVLLVGGAKLADEVARRVRPALGCTLQQVFGMAEGLVCYTRLDDDPDTVVTTQGRPISPDDEIRVVDDEDEDLPVGATGHLLTRGPYTIRGYWNAPDHNARAFTEDGFYRTGDLVRLTPSGHLVVEGRAKDQINRGGEKIAAEEVENHLLAHPSVHDANVVAEPDPYLGERSCAYVIRRRGAEEVKAPALKRFVRERGLAAYKVPDRIVFVDAFRRRASGRSPRRTSARRARAPDRPPPAPPPHPLRNGPS